MRFRNLLPVLLLSLAACAQGAKEPAAKRAADAGRFDRDLAQCEMQADAQAQRQAARNLRLAAPTGPAAPTGGLLGAPLASAPPLALDLPLASPSQTRSASAAERDRAVRDCMRARGHRDPVIPTTGSQAR